MRTLVISDLHLGSRRPVDILRRPEPLDALCSGLGGIDRLVLLGDVLELRQGPAREALSAAQPVLEAIGAALPQHAEVVITAGNHDYALVSPWLAGRGLREEFEPLGLAQPAPTATSPIAQAMKEWLGDGRSVSLSYPGVWLRDDVWATHGHYLDRLITIPTFERIAAGGMARVVGRLPEPGEGSADPDEFEAALAPMYAWLDQLANGRAAGGRWAAGAATAKAWSLLSADGRAPLRGKALAALLPLGIAGINLAGLGPVRSKIDSDELRRAGVAAMAGVVKLLGVEAGYVIFGHTHCAGPLPWMDPGDWVAPGGTQLINTGCWTDEPHIDMNNPRNPYRPGYAVLVEDEGPPRLVRITENLGLRRGSHGD